VRVLLTNHELVHRAGSQLYLADLAARLLARGHSPVVYSPRLGRVAEALRLATIPVVDRLDAIGEPPELIHGQHHLETLKALLHFPGVPALFVCHGWLPWEEVPPRFPRILRYLAVDLVTRERLVSERGIPPDQVAVILNFVDLARFRPRGPLPPAPRRALVLSNQASEQTFLPAIREACSRFGIDVAVAGIASGLPADRPEDLLPGYDLVFAKARAALEAMAVGAAVVLCDQTGAGPLVMSGNFDRLRPLNFGLRTLSHPVEPEFLASQIERYDAADAAEVARRIRATAGLEDAVDRILELYDRVIAEHRRQGSPSPEAESRATADYLHWLTPYFQERYQAAVVDRNALKTQVASLLHEHAGLVAKAASLRQQVADLGVEAAGWRRQAADLHWELQTVLKTATWRWRERLLQFTPLVRAYRFLRRSDQHERVAADTPRESERQLP
jgi:Glycosyltransferase Family 4